MFLITGCGRSGTKYMQEVLCAAGLDAGHEEAGADGAVSSVWCAPRPPYPSYHQQGPRPDFDLVLHQVREPLATIGSITTSKDESWEFNARWIPINLRWPVLKRSIWYWYWWNYRAEQQACYTYRIENLRAEWPVLMALIGHDAPYSVTRAIPKDTNSREHRKVTWDDFPTSFPPVIDMARRYGYEVRR